VGIEEESMSRIFEPFYSTKSKGTGLGLAICREITELHHGEIDISSAKGEGATVKITLPIAQE